MSYPLRKPCRQCGGSDGHIETKSGQDCVYCIACGLWEHNAPRLETGRALRTLSTRPGLTVSQRARVFDAHDHRCIACGRSAGDGVTLDLGHLISRDDAEAHGFLDEIIDSEWNLAPMCAECNSGQRPLGSIGIRLMYRTLLIKATPR
jgi:5-methylcytosine-specific restriction endonuclease McrA